MPNLIKIVGNDKIFSKLNPLPSYIDLLHETQASLISRFGLTKTEAKELFNNLKNYNNLCKMDISDNPVYKTFIALGLPEDLSSYLFFDEVTVEQIDEQLLSYYNEYNPEIIETIKENLKKYYDNPKYFISQANKVMTSNDYTERIDTGIQRSVRIQRLNK